MFSDSVCIPFMVVALIVLVLLNAATNEMFRNYRRTSGRPPKHVLGQKKG